MPMKDSIVLEIVSICFILFFSPGSRVVNHFSSRISFHSSSSSSDKDFFHYLRNLDCAFKTLQMSSNNITVIANGGVKKSHIATVVAHVWFNNSVTQCLQVNSINITLIEAKLMAIHLGLIPTIEKENIHNIVIITDSIAVARKIFESKVDPL